MGLTLQKGGNLSLSKTDPGLKVAMLGLGWDPRTTDGKKFDLDASAFLLDANGKVRSNADFVFYHQVNSGCGSVTHTGDNQTGEGEGDDETILVDFSKVPAVVEKIVLTVTIHDAAIRGQNFGQVGGAKIRVVNNDTQNEIVKYDLSEDYSTETAMIFGELYRHGTEWKFRAVGQGFNGGLEQMCAQFGVQIDG